MKVEEIFLVSDPNTNQIIPFQKEDLALVKKNKKAIDLSFSGAFLVYGFWKITIKSYFFGFFKKLELEKLDMEL